MLRLNTRATRLQSDGVGRIRATLGDWSISQALEASCKFELYLYRPAPLSLTEINLY